jgi:hypothetical protein
MEVFILWKYNNGRVKMKKKGLLLAVLTVVAVTLLIEFIVKCELCSYGSTSQIDRYSKNQDSMDLYIDYTPDSLYKIEYDTIVRVSYKKSGKIINEFNVSQSNYPEYPFLRQMEIDPSGKYLAFLDNLNIVRVYNIFTGECEGVNDYYFDRSSHIYFSDDSRYFLIVDFREAEVDILSCPRLEFIASGSMGYYRSNFWWENQNGKLVFYYEVVDSLYKTVFPDDGHGDSLVFSKPVAIDKVIRDTL